MKISEIRTLEEKILTVIEEVRDSVVKEVRDNPLPDVKQISASPRAAIVRLSTVQKYGGVLSAEYYIPESQAELVRQRLDGVKTATEFTSRVRDMIDTNFVKVGTNKHMLNPRTVDVLKKYVEE